jgi:hypothetical protein
MDLMVRIAFTLKEALFMNSIQGVQKETGIFLADIPRKRSRDWNDCQRGAEEKKSWVRVSEKFMCFAQIKGARAFRVESCRAYCK